MDQARHILRSVFGYQHFRQHQEDVIAALLEGRDVLNLMPTGGGKSLCYQIPSLVRSGCGVVVSPLIALMQDQVDGLQQLGINAAFLNSTLDYLQVEATEQALLDGVLDLLYVAPERLLTPKMLTLLEDAEIALFAIDEAHCVSQWGHDFRKEYQQLSVLHERFPNVPRVALTATADERTRLEIIQQLHLDQAEVFIHSFDRPNIRYTVSDSSNGRQQLLKFIETHHPEDAGIVYCLSRNKVETVAQWLCEQGRVALRYHAGLPPQVRQRAQDRFLREDGLIMVATIAFGMGIDKPDVRFVAHLNLPKSVEAYYQETGRAGRDGLPANAWMSYGLQDVITLRQMTEGSDAAEQYKRLTHQKLEAMLALCEITTCRRQSLLAYFGETLSQPCGNCDNCLEPPETWDGTVAAQKALSCVYRCGQRFGVGYVIDILMGKSNDRIIGNGHDQLSTFGIGEELNATEWRGVFRQLIVRGYLKTDHEGYGVLHLTEKCRPLMRSEETLWLRKMRKKAGGAKKSKVSAAREAWNRSSLQGDEEELFFVLRDLRRELAEEQSLPAYMIFHDRTLVEMAKLRPTDLDAFAQINGVGESKLQRYGELFLAEIKRY